MDLSQFNKTQTASKSSKGKKASNPVTRTFLSLKDWVYPPITTLRQQRINQYKDLALFAGAALVVVVFEDKIKNFLEIDTDFAKMGMGGPAQF
jgi:hypothetical protein